jgi:hypothetical protein
MVSLRCLLEMGVGVRFMSQCMRSRVEEMEFQAMTR